MNLNQQAGLSAILPPDAGVETVQPQRGDRQSPQRTRGALIAHVLDAPVRAQLPPKDGHHTLHHRARRMVSVSFHRKHLRICEHPHKRCGYRRGSQSSLHHDDVFATRSKPKTYPSRTSVPAFTPFVPAGTGHSAGHLPAFAA
jgi:hypothetical protein